MDCGRTRINQRPHTTLGQSGLPTPARDHRASDRFNTYHSKPQHQRIRSRLVNRSSRTMSSLFGSSASTPSDMQARKEQMKQQISQELAIANAQQLINVSVCGWTEW